jgi:hypothetical protein
MTKDERFSSSLGRLLLPSTFAKRNEAGMASTFKMPIKEDDVLMLYVLTAHLRQ